VTSTVLSIFCPFLPGIIAGDGAAASQPECSIRPSKPCEDRTPYMPLTPMPLSISPARTLILHRAVRLINHGVLQHAKLVDGNANHVPWLEPDFWIHAQNDPAGRAGGHHIAGFERKDGGQVGHNIAAEAAFDRGALAVGISPGRGLDQLGLFEGVEYGLCVEESPAVGQHSAKLL
jgi:hypothetical protein